MKTSAMSPSGGSSHHGYSLSGSGAQTLKPGGRGSSRTSTPIASPTKMPYSVGQAYPPKLSPGRPADRAPSPNYFGFVVEGPADQRDSSAMPREHWSPPSSSVKPFAAAIPKQVPLDANPEFEAFKRQADLNRGRSSLNLSTAHAPQAPTLEASQSDPSQLSRPMPPRWNTHSSAMSDVSMGTSRPGQSFIKERRMSRMDVDQEGLQDSAYGSSESKRSSESSSHHTPPLDMSKRDAAMMPPPINISQSRSNVSKAEDRDPRLSVMGNRPDPPSPQPGSNLRAGTMPPRLTETGPSMMLPHQLHDMLSNDSSRILLLDVRSAQNYAQAHIDGALNLCIPTTLLKRATFNLQKLQQTFQRSGDQAVFSRWRDAEHLVVYDAFSSEQAEATTAMNMIKKFTNEGYNGSTAILRGGFQYFVEEYPDMIHYQTRDSPVMSPGGVGSGPKTGLAPVIGGVMLPNSGNTPNPFFSNIRQNMDLADGVGQMDVTRPSGLESPSLPRWLRQAAEVDDHGKRVSDKFLGIEKDEQSRMRQAYSLFGGNPPPKQTDCPQLCGIEQGGKNRYKDILPFEHARVRLAGIPEGSSDYVNASHIKASGSNKRYIATQGPLPTTFEDFWSVIWDQDVRVIVMLTAESEGGQLKCHQYWQGRDYGAIRLKSLSEKKISLDIDKHRSDSTVALSSTVGETGRRRANTVSSAGSSSTTPTPQQTPGGGGADSPYVIIRKFALSHATHPFAPIREITHLHYPSWPDFGVPARPAHLLALVELANVMQRAALPIETSSVSRRAETLPITWYDEPEAEARARPMLVHCSAGCGRTGAFCTVDTVIDMLKRQRMERLAKVTRARREREQQQQQQQQKDGDGDSAMDLADEGISPLSTRQMSFSGHAMLGGGAASRRTSNSSVSTTATAGGSSSGAGGVAPPSMPPGPPLDTSWVDDETVDLIQKTVEDFRRQRLSMVQSLRQFVLCYEAVLEWTWRMNEKTMQSVTTPAAGGSSGGAASRARAPLGRARSGSLYTRRDG